METVKQFTVRLVNKPGRYVQVLAALQKEKAAIRAMCVMDSATRGTLRLVPDDPALAKSALETINIPFEKADVLLVELNGSSGGLPRLCQRLAEEHLNIDYLYGSLGSNGSRGVNLAVIKVNDLAKAQRVLTETRNNNRTKKRPGRRPAHAR